MSERAYGSADDATYVVVEERDPVVTYLRFGIALVIITILVSAIYVLVQGVFSDRAPQTALESSIAIARSATEQLPANGQAWGDYIRLLVVAEEYGKAQEAIADARENVAGASLAWVNNAELRYLIATGKNEEAVELAPRFVQQDIDWRAEVANELAQQGVRATAETLPSDSTVELWMLKATAEGGVGDWESAIESLTFGLKYQPNSADLLALRGNAYLAVGDTEQARKDFEAALKYVPDYAPALRGLEEVQR
ncbi:MAG: tetratricopeptide repeat protein [Anaerosomatales bacterium]|nr:tetratricopeptide repeat protein [Anaerosomatales bacterium]